ncbi:MAG: manganese catalase family protein [Clostridia bacterium]|nr:manganese catalase family protein [Clostridia bacterium]
MNYELANKLDFEKEFKVNKEYPQITVTNLPFEVISKIKRLYADRRSEMTSVMQYIYQHFILSSAEGLENISHAMEEIAVKEMEHYEILAKIMVNCGVDPRSCVYIDNNIDICDYWKANYVNYTRDFIDIFEKDIILEQAGINSYVELIEMTDNENLKEIVERIIEDEKSHIAYFRAVLELVKK